MKISRFTDSQIMQILKQAEAGISAPELCREHGMSSATFYKWRAKYGGMDASMVSRLKELEDENRRFNVVGLHYPHYQRSISCPFIYFNWSTCSLNSIENVKLIVSDPIYSVLIVSA